MFSSKGALCTRKATPNRIQPFLASDRVVVVYFARKCPDQAIPYTVAACSISGPLYVNSVARVDSHLLVLNMGAIQATKAIFSLSSMRMNQLLCYLSPVVSICDVERFRITERSCIVHRNIK